MTPVAGGGGGARDAAVARGEVVLRDATRHFSVRADHGRTLKGTLIGRRSTGPEPVPALSGVTLRIEPGETVAIIGRNGAGKSSTLRVLAGIIPLQSGSAECGGRVVSLIELGTGFARDFSGRENIYLQGALYGFSRAEIDARLAAIIEFSELGRFIDVPIKTYSMGMFLRLGFSIAVHLDADVLLIDEVLAVGDDAFQRKCLERIAAQIARGTTLVLVSHELPAVERVCARVIVLEHGEVVFDGPVAEGLMAYRRRMGTDQSRSLSLRASGAGAGAGAVGVAELELQDGEGRPATIFHAGSVLRVSALVRSAGADGCLRLEFSARQGALLFRVDRLVGGEAGEEVRVCFEIERLGLLRGDFDVVARAGAQPAIDEAPAERVVSFSVMAEDGEDGLVDLRGTWSVGAAVDAGAGAGVRG